MKDRFNLAVSYAAWMFAAIFLFYSVIFAANMLGVPFYLGYRRFMVDIVVLSPMVDRFLWVCSLTAFSTLLFIQQEIRAAGLRSASMFLYGLVLSGLVYAGLVGFRIFGVVFLMASGLAYLAFSILYEGFDGWRFPLVLLSLYGMVMLLGVEAASLTCWIYHLLSPTPIFEGGGWNIAFAEVQISSILYPLLPVIMMFFIFSWIGEFTFKGLLFRGEDGAGWFTANLPIPGLRSSRIPLMVVLTSVFAGLFIGYYNFAVSGLFNPGFPGVDIPGYAEYLREVSGMGVANALIHAAGNDRFLYLAFQYFCFQLSGMPVDVFVAFVMPVILVFLLMLSTLLLVWVGRSNYLYAATAMLATAFSYQVTVGLYAGFYANWFALSLTYVFYSLLMMAFKGFRRAWLLGLTGLTSIAVLYSHPWTWILLVMMIPLAYILVTLLLVWVRRMPLHRHVWELKFLATLLTVNLIMFYVRDFFRVGSGAAVASVERFNPSFLNTFNLKYFLDWTFNWYVGGFYAYIPILVLAILGVFSLLDYGDRYNRLLLTWMLAASAMVFVDFPWHARFLYMTPFNIYVAFGILYGGGKLYRLASLTRLKPIAPALFWIFYTLSILLLSNYTIRSVALKQFGPAGLTLTSPNGVRPIHAH